MQEYSIRELQSQMESGEFTSRRIVEMYLERIDSLDRGKVNSIIEINPDALSIASGLDEERRGRKLRGPLHGIPILVKDNIDSGDRMQTTAGSLAMEGHRAAHDAFVVRRLRDAGAVILGKTNLSEWANFRGKRSISGWSSRGGLTRNPYALDRSACGSSSGSGAAVAANFCAGAVGTETDGSIICPSQTNGIVGIKPTLGYLSRSGIIPIAHSQDTPGPMARSVEDAALLLAAMRGVDANDSVTKAGGKRAASSFEKSFDRGGLRGARIGVARNMCGSDARLIEIFEQAIAAMKDLGAIIIDPADVPNFNKFGKTELDVLHFEFKADLNRYLAKSNAPMKSMQDVINFNEEHAASVLKYFGQEHLQTAQEKPSLRDAAYRAALKKNRQLTRERGIDAALKKYKLDALVVPSGGPAWMIDLANGDAINWDMESTSTAAVAGYPHITVPAGFVHGLPVGISFFGGAWREAELVKYAYAYEQATKMRRPPQFLNSISA